MNANTLSLRHFIVSLIAIRRTLFRAIKHVGTKTSKVHRCCSKIAMCKLLKASAASVLCVAGIARTAESHNEGAGVEPTEFCMGHCI